MGIFILWINKSQLKKLFTHSLKLCEIHWEKWREVGFGLSSRFVIGVLSVERVRFPSPAPLLHPSFWTVYGCDRVVSIMILNTDSILNLPLTLQLKCYDGDWRLFFRLLPGKILRKNHCFLYELFGINAIILLLLI